MQIILFPFRFPARSFQHEFFCLLIGRLLVVLFQMMYLPKYLRDTRVDHAIDDNVVFFVEQNRSAGLRIDASLQLFRIQSVEDQAHARVVPDAVKHQKEKLVLADLRKVDADVVQLRHVVDRHGGQDRDNGIVLLIAVDDFSDRRNNDPYSVGYGAYTPVQQTCAFRQTPTLLLDGQLLPVGAGWFQSMASKIMTFP